MALTLQPPNQLASQQEPVQITNVPSTVNPPCDPTQVIPGTLLFSESFDGGIAHGFPVHSYWKVVNDETGNPVFEVNNQVKRPVAVEFRGVDWCDYRIEYRVRFKKFGDDVGGTLVFRRREEHLYVLSLNQEEVILARIVNSGYWERLATILHPLQLNTWYNIRAEAQGSRLRVWLNNELLIDLEDTLSSSGIITFDAAPNEQTQYDDIRVTAL
ncbi:MAG: hypothetical protein K8L99_08675 [Anaerolineae bacterium]|nr:hypothetical protein [Anaerolineae bacterium]